MNIAKLNRLADWLENAPAAYDQRSWVRVPKTLGKVPVSRVIMEGICGTKVCAAGAEVAFSAPPGSLFTTLSDTDFFMPDLEGSFWFRQGVMHDSLLTAAPEGTARYRKEDIEEFAIESLGVSPNQADFLFNDGHREREEVIAGLRYLADHPDASESELLEKCT